MVHDVFISHSSKDRLIADAVVVYLEQAGIRCWMTPRDIPPGASWASAIIDGINQCRAMVVIFSSNTNQSDHVSREIERAVHHGLSIVPVRIEAVLPHGDLEYFLSSSHWMDALTPPLERHLGLLANTLSELLKLPLPAKALPSMSPSVSRTFAGVLARRRPGLLVASAAGIVSAGALALYLSLGQKPPASTPAEARNLQASRLTAIPQAPAMVVPSADTAKAANDAVAAGPTPAKAPATEPALPRPRSVGWTSNPAVSAPAEERTRGSGGTNLQSQFADYEKQVLKGSTTPYFAKYGPINSTIWLSQAEAGDVQAQILIGRCYMLGEGVEKNESEGVKWFSRAAGQGNASGIFNLGIAHKAGSGGLKRDEETAFRMLREASGRGNIPATRELGSMYYYGSRAADENGVEARRLYQLAIEKNDVVALLYMGKLYEFGAAGITRNAAEAALWYQRAAAAGNQPAKAMLAAESLGKAMASFSASGASLSQRQQAVRQVKEWGSGHRDLTAEGLLQVLSDRRVKPGADVLNQKSASDTIRTDAVTDSMKAAFERIAFRTFSEYRQAGRSFRQNWLGSFANATSTIIVGWARDKKYRKVADFWQTCYSDLELKGLSEGDRHSLFLELGACVKALLATGNRREAVKQLADVLALSDVILDKRPWDWFVKDVTTGICWETAEMLTDMGEKAQVQSLLRRAWAIQSAQYGYEELIQRYPELPLKGQIPPGAEGDDRIFFLNYASGKNPEKQNTLSKLSIPVDFSGTKYPIDFYLLSGKRGYLELQDQFRRIHEYQGG